MGWRRKLPPRLVSMFSRPLLNNQLYEVSLLSNHLGMNAQRWNLPDQRPVSTRTLGQLWDAMATTQRPLFLTVGLPLGLQAVLSSLLCPFLKNSKHSHRDHQSNTSTSKHQRHQLPANAPGRSQQSSRLPASPGPCSHLGHDPLSEVDNVCGLPHPLSLPGSPIKTNFTIHWFSSSGSWDGSGSGSWACVAAGFALSPRTQASRAARCCMQRLTQDTTSQGN